MSIVRSSVHAKWVVGKVIGTAMIKTAKVRATRLVLDPYLLKVRTNTCFKMPSIKLPTFHCSCSQPVGRDAFGSHMPDVYIMIHNSSIIMATR